MPAALFRYSLSLLLIFNALIFLCTSPAAIALKRGSKQGRDAERDQGGASAMFRGGASHKGVYQPVGPSGYGGLQWRFQTNGAVRSSPTLSGGTVYFGSSDGRVYAVDARTGIERWRFDARSPVTSTPAVAGGRVYVNTYDGRLLALNALGGRQAWSLKTGADAPLAWGHESGDFFTSSPAVSGRVVVSGGGDGFLRAVDGAAGRELWKVKTGGRIRSSPAVEGGMVFAGSFDGSLYAVDLKSGKLLWRFETEGAKLNSAEFGYDRRSVQSSPAVADGTVFFGARDGFLYAVAADSGKLRWRFDHEISWVNSSPAAADGMVYAGSSDGRFVQCVDARTGKEVWRLKTDNLVWSSPALSGGNLYAGDWAGNLYAVDRTSGKELWRYRAQKRILSSPAVEGGRVYFGSDDGGLYALNLSEAGSLNRAVFWDADYVKGASFRGHEAMRDYFKESGYRVLDARGLAEFLRDRLKDRSRSIVVFAIDHLPKTVMDDEGGGQSLFRRYLDGGGKVVWVGLPPLLWPRDIQTGQRDIKKIGRAATERLLGVGHLRGNFDANTARATAQGARWGLSGWWLSNWSADPGNVTTVLAEDEQGLAAAWVRRYAVGAPEGTGFVRIPLTETAGGVPTNLPEIKLAAEFFPE